jgi:DNA-binding MarR family transcriptional regulator
MDESVGPKEIARMECTCFNLRKATRLVTQAYDEALRPAGIRSTQFTILALVRGRGPLALRELAEALVVERTTLTRNLNPLERDGLVASRPGADQRVREISLTRKGQKSLDQAYPLWKQTQKSLRRVLGASEVDNLVAGLQATVAGLQEP